MSIVSRYTTTRSETIVNDPRFKTDDERVSQIENHAAFNLLDRELDEDAPRPFDIQKEVKKEYVWQANT